MSRKKAHSAEEIVAKLRQIEVGVSKGTTPPQARYGLKQLYYR